MRDYPIPTFGFDQLLPNIGALTNLFNRPKPASTALRAPVSVSAAPPTALDRAKITTTWATHLDEVREAQRLRYNVFANEMGARLHSPIAGHDVDDFDDHCEHLLVRDMQTDEVVGTYRVLMPEAANRLGHWYTETEFDLSDCRITRANTVELGRSCVHRTHRTGPAIHALWAELAAFMSKHRMETMIGCASIPMHSAGQAFALGPAMAASIFRKLSSSMVDPNERAKPRCALPIRELDDSLEADPPALIKAYLRLGANILGDPAWDPDFNTADLPMRMRISDLPTRYRRHFARAN